MWPFKKKVKVEEQVEKKPEFITIYAKDGGLRRAEVALRHAGIGINQATLNLLPWIAQILDEYKKLDYIEFANSRKRKKKSANLTEEPTKDD